MFSFPQISDAYAYTRISSLHGCAAVDVYWTFHNQAGWSSVDFNSHLLFRFVETMDVLKSGPHDFSGGRPRQGRNGWKPIFDMGLADIPPGRRWRAVDELAWGLTVSDANKIHRTLFGKKTKSPGSQISKVDTIRLLFAAVTLPFNVAKSEDDKLSDCIDRRARIRWKLGNEDWVALNIRKSCGVPLKRDAKYKPKKSYVEEEDDDDDDSYGDDSDRYSSDRYSGGW